MNLPAETELRAERFAFLATVRELSTQEFDNAPTLCAGWAPRDVLAHLLGVDDGLADYARSLGNISAGNAAVVARGRTVSRQNLLDRAERWAAHPALHARLAAFFLLGDVAVHHRDVLRGLGREPLPEPSPAAAAAILREGYVLGALRAVQYRLVPTDGGRSTGLPGRPEVRGTREALGLWLTGRSSVATELHFAAAA